MPHGVTSPKPERLYHYSCHHLRNKLGALGTLTPQPQPQFVKYGLIWLTDLTAFNPVALGMNLPVPGGFGCDRTTVCYEVIQPTEGIDPIFSWKDWCALVHLDRTMRSAQEFGRLHQHWWVATQPVTAILVQPNPLVVL